MKRTISTLTLAAPLATVALSLGATPAMAQPADPSIDELQIAELGPQIQPEIPEEELPQPEDPERPDGPGEVKDKDPCPTHGPCDERPDDEDGDDSDGDDADEDDSDGDDFDKPNRIDAGAGANDEGMELAWLMAGGGLITATGAAYAVRRRSSMGA